MPSEASSAVASESDLPSAVASEPDLPSTMVTESNILVQSHLQPSEPKKQTGIYDFFQALSADEIELVRAKSKRASSEEEEADWVVRRQKEQQQKEKKADARWEKNQLAQQKHRSKLVTIDIQTGVRDSSGKRIQVSYSPNFMSSVTIIS